MQITQKTFKEFDSPIIRRERGRLPDIVTPYRERTVWTIDVMPEARFETQAQAVEMVRHLNGA